MRDGVEGPGQLAVVEIPGAHIHGGTVRIVFFALGPGDDQIAEDNARGREVVRRLWKLLGNSGPQVHDTFLSESWNELARLCIDGDQAPVAGSRQYLGRGLLVAWPVSDTAQRGGDAAQI